MREIFVAIVLFGLCYSTLAEEPKKKRNIGIFNVVKFANDPCEGSNSKNGTCYTEEECEDKGGTASGNCAEGYGVCCTFSMNCGGSFAENMTYFESTKGATGACNARVCKCASDICQMRLDFTTFVIAGPETTLTTLGKALNGALGAGDPVSPATRCLSDQFSVTSPGGQGSPVICGTNTGQHMYIEASDSCNTLSFHLDDNNNANREFAIRVTQYSCDYMNKAPAGCLQYFFGSSTGTFETFNWANMAHLASQNQLICFRRETNMCRICYSTSAATDFAISAKKDSALIGKTGVCGLYGADGKKSDYDFLQIPMASKKTGSGDLVKSNDERFCGHLLATATGKDAKTVCSKAVPFQVRFVSDGFEGMKEIDAAMMTFGNKGFKLNYEMFAC